MTNEGTSGLGERVRKLRDLKGLTQVELAALLQQSGRSGATSQSHVAGIESGSTSASVDTLIALAQVLNTTTDYLLGLTENHLPASPENLILRLPDASNRSLFREAFDLLSAIGESQQLIIMDVLRMAAQSIRRGKK